MEIYIVYDLPDTKNPRVTITCILKVVILLVVIITHYLLLIRIARLHADDLERDSREHNQENNDKRSIATFL